MRTQTAIIAIIMSGMLVLTVWPGASAAPRGGEVYVAAAVSLSDVLSDLAGQFERERGIRVNLDCGSSGILRKKIEAGTRCDIFLSASARDMNVLQDAGYVDVSTRRELLGNSIVCVVPADSNLTLSCPADLTRPEIKRIAIGDPQHVPAGIYFQQAIVALGLGDQIAGKLIPCANVRATLAQAELGTVDAAIIYSTDAAASSRVRIAFTFPVSSHAQITYPMSVLKQTSNPKAAEIFLEFLASDHAANIFREYGFEPIQGKVR